MVGRPEQGLEGCGSTKAKEGSSRRGRRHSRVGCKCPPALATGRSGAPVKGHFQVSPGGGALQAGSPAILGATGWPLPPRSLTSPPHLSVPQHLSGNVLIPSVRNAQGSGRAEPSSGPFVPQSTGCRPGPQSPIGGSQAACQKPKEESVGESRDTRQGVRGLEARGRAHRKHSGCLRTRTTNNQVNGLLAILAGGEWPFPRWG